MLKLPLYRLEENIALMGVDIPYSMLVERCGRAMKVLAPPVERIEADVMPAISSMLLTPRSGCWTSPQKGRCLRKRARQSRIWAYVRDLEPWTGTAPPGAVYRFAPDWKQEHVHGHLAQTRGSRR